MSPTIPNNINADKRPGAGRPSRPSTGERRSELVCRVKYCNTLPDIPSDPKFITYPFETNRFIQYNPTSLERNYKYEVLTEHDLGVTIDLIDREQYSNFDSSILDKADENLLEEDILTPHDVKRTRHIHARSVSWLRRTEYISTESTRFQPPVMDKIEAKVGFSIKRNLKEETLYMDRDSQIKAIEKTYEDVKKPIERHYSKANVTPVEILPVFPDFEMWKYPCAQVMFDTDPAPVGRPFPAQLEEMSQAMIRGVMDESGEQFVAYFLPTEPTLEKRRRDFTSNVDYVDDEEYEYKIAREYNWNVKTKASKGYEENYFLVVRKDGIYFNELETRVRLTKRRQKAGQQPNNTRLVVKHRPMDAQEFTIHRTREKQLEPPVDEEDEEEEEEEEDEKKDSEDEKQDSGEESGKDKSGEESGKESADSDKEEKRGSESGSDKENRAVKKKKTRRRSSGGSSSGSERSGSPQSDQGKSEDEKSDKSDEDKSNGEKSDGEKSDGEKSDGEKSDGEKSDAGKSDKSDQKSQSDKSDEEKSHSESEGEKSDKSGQAGTHSDRSEAEKSAAESDAENSDREKSDGDKSNKSGSAKSRSATSSSGSGSDSE